MRIIEATNYGFEAGLLLAELLGTIRVAPDIGVFKFEQDFFQLFTFVVVVKDTPEANLPWISGLRYAAKSGLFPPWTPAFEKTRILPDLGQ